MKPHGACCWSQFKLANKLTVSPYRRAKDLICIDQIVVNSALEHTWYIAAYFYSLMKRHQSSYMKPRLAHPSHEYCYERVIERKQDFVRFKCGLIKILRMNQRVPVLASKSMMLNSYNMHLNSVTRVVQSDLTFGRLIFRVEGIIRILDKKRFETRANEKCSTFVWSRTGVRTSG